MEGKKNRSQMRKARWKNLCLSFLEFSDTRLDLINVTDMNENGINERRQTTMCYMNKYFKKYGRKPKPTELEQFIKKEQWISQTYKPPLGT